MSVSDRIGAVVLAAGSARRFGADKRLQSLAGSTVAETTLEKYCQVFDAVRVVVQGTADPLYAKLSCREDLEIVFSPDANLGMGHSLAAGFTDLPWQYAFVALADMPLVAPATLERLKSAAMQDQERIIRPRFNDEQYGHPIGFPRTLFAEMQKCHGDTGARSVLAAHKDRSRIIACSDQGVVQDIDTPAALAEAQALERPSA